MPPGHDRQLMLAKPYFCGIEPKEKLSTEVQELEVAIRAHRAAHQQAFKLIDADGSGEVEASELHNIFRRLGMEVSEGQVRRVLKLVDRDRSGTIDIDEFIEALEAGELGDAKEQASLEVLQRAAQELALLGKWTNKAIPANNRPIASPDAKPGESNKAAAQRRAQRLQAAALTSDEMLKHHEDMLHTQIRKRATEGSKQRIVLQEALRQRVGGHAQSHRATDAECSTQPVPQSHGIQEVITNAASMRRRQFKEHFKASQESHNEAVEQFTKQKRQGTTFPPLRSASCPPNKPRAEQEFLTQVVSSRAVCGQQEAARRRQQNLQRRALAESPALHEAQIRKAQAAMMDPWLEATPDAGMWWLRGKVDPRLLGSRSGSRS